MSHADSVVSAAPELFEDVADRYGTPFFLYDVDVFRANVERVRAAFERQVAIYFAVKANPNLELLRSIRTIVDGLDVSSIGEYEQAKLAGYAPKSLSFAGPAKTAAELRPVIEDEIGSISVESQRELDKIARIAAKAGVRANVTIRVNPLKNSRAFGLRMGGKATQFGIDEEDLTSVAKVVVAQQKHISFVGIHVYAGSQGFDDKLLANGILDTIRICQDVEHATGMRCESINFGGGFGVSHGSAKKTVDLSAVYARVKTDFDDLKKNGNRQLVFELGRFLVANAGIYVSRAVSTKQSRGKAFVVVDGGLHHHLAAAGMFGVGIRTNYEVRNLTQPGADRISCNVAGPSCNPTDLLGVNLTLPSPAIGDLIGIMTSGSYAFTASPLLFLGRPTPAEILLENGEIRLARRSYQMTDFN